MQLQDYASIIHLGPKKNSVRPWGGVIFAVSHTWKVNNLANIAIGEVAPHFL
jgi:hypothetical protein